MVSNLLTKSVITLRTTVIGIAANAVIRIGSSCKTTTEYHEHLGPKTVPVQIMRHTQNGILSVPGENIAKRSLIHFHSQLDLHFTLHGKGPFLLK